MENTVIHLDDGKYVIQLKAIKKDSEDASAMEAYLAKQAILTVTGGEVFITLSILKQGVVTQLQVVNEAGEGVTSLEQHIDTEEEIRYEIFQLPRLSKLLPVRVQYEVEHDGRPFRGDEPFRLYFDQESIENLDQLKLE